jgi:hypothetical protein
MFVRRSLHKAIQGKQHKLRVARFVLRELVAHCGADFVVALAIKTICGSTAKIGTVSISQTRACGSAYASLSRCNMKLPYSAGVPGGVV